MMQRSDEQLREKYWNVDLSSSLTFCNNVNDDNPFISLTFNLRQKNDHEIEIIFSHRTISVVRFG